MLSQIWQRQNLRHLCAEEVELLSLGNEGARALAGQLWLMRWRHFRSATIFFRERSPFCHSSCQVTMTMTALDSDSKRVAKAKRLSDLCRDDDLERNFFILTACIRLDEQHELYYLARSEVAFSLGLFARSVEDAEATIERVKRCEETIPPGRLNGLRAKLDEIRAKALSRSANARVSLGQLNRARRGKQQAESPECQEGVG